MSSTVSVENSRPKFPSGVAFRRAFVEFGVLGADDRVLWLLGRPDGNGVIVDGEGTALSPASRWWTADCAQRIQPAARLHQPHYQKIITGQDQAQIYEEPVAQPSDGPAPVCGRQRHAGGKADHELPVDLRQGEG